MRNQEAQAYRHTWDGEHYFYYHHTCVESNPPGAEVIFEPLALDDVPQGAECDFCYKPVEENNGSHVNDLPTEWGGL